MIVQNFRSSREMLNLKQKNLTNLFNVTYSTISGWETGKDTIPLRQLIKYANYFGLSLDYLFGLSSINDSYFPLIIDLNIIANDLRFIRKSRGFTQQDIAKFLNTSSSTYDHYENARYLILTSFLYSISLFYTDISIDKILGRKKKI